MRFTALIPLLLLASSCSTSLQSDMSDAQILRQADGQRIPAVALDQFVRQQRAELNIPGISLAVIMDGKIAHSLAIGVKNIETGEPVNEVSVFEAASLSKPVFAYFAIKLADQGVLDLDRPLHEYLPLPEMEADGRYRSITARMALSHQTGFPTWRWFDPAWEDMGVERGSLYMKHDPGTFGYSGEGYHYLAQVIAHLTGRDLTTLDGLYQDVVAKPLQLDCSAFVRTPCVAERKVTGHMDGAIFADWPRSFPDDTPQTFGAGGRLHANALDYARFMLALMQDADIEGSIGNRMLVAQVAVPRDSDTHRLTGQTAWGLGLAHDPTPHGLRYEHGGNNNNYQAGMMFMPEQGIGYVFLTNSDKGQEFGERLERFFDSGR